MIIVTGFIDTTDHGSAFADAIQKFAAAARQRPGCISYAIAPDYARHGRFLVVERWIDQAALTGHIHSEATANFGSKWAGKFTGNVHKYDATNERDLLVD